jgi:TonB family protein
MGFTSVAESFARGKFKRGRVWEPQAATSIRMRLPLAFASISGHTSIYPPPQIDRFVMPSPDSTGKDRNLRRLRGEAPARPPRPAREDSRQRGLMGGALFLLLLALTIVLWHDRQFWFPETQEAESAGAAEQMERPEQAEQPEDSPTASSGRAAAPLAKRSKSAKGNSRKEKQLASNSPAAARPSKAQPAAAEPNPDASEDGPPGAIIGARTVLPPLEVEVVAGDKHRTMRPGSNAVHVELQPDAPAAPAMSAPAESESAANVTSEAAERVQMSASTADNVAEPVRPDYPLLARQMKVQGSVILQALIGRDGEIQNLHVVRGPHILAAAAQDAVRQWHFKPHFEAGEAVETQAKITVNFTISTN